MNATWFLNGVELKVRFVLIGAGQMQGTPQPKVAALVALAMLASLFPALAVAAQPRSPFAVAAVFPPWWGQDRAREAAEAAGIVSRVGRGNIVVVYGGLDLSDQLKREGALAIVDPRIADCLVEGNRP
ncbi:MAG: hypothetical protein K2X25_14145 [Caulobacteraceae bacterium]|nr:hypothetical protein [Caulobacteraceae bacterium]